MTASRTKPTAAVNVNDDDGREAFTVGLATATTIGLSPRWVQYSGVSLAARAAAEILTDMATMHTHGDQAPTLDRERLAYHVGIGRADKVAPVLDELVAIGFLTIYSGGVDPTTGKRRQRRDSQGRPITDRFSITLEPPYRYVGPTTMTEADAAFAADRDAAYQAAKDTGKRVRAGNITIYRNSIGQLTNPQVSTDPSSRGHDGGGDPGIRGHRATPQVSPDTGIRGQGGSADPGFRGQLTVPQVTADTGIRGHLQIDRSAISEREIEGSIEPVPGGTAKPPATGLHEQAVTESRQLVRRLPWSEWAELRGVEFQLMQGDADAVQAAICDAMAAAGITLDQAAEIGRAALAEAKTNPVGYVTDAFRKHLPRRLKALAVEPLANNPLPLPNAPSSARPGAPKPQAGTSKAVGQQGTGRPAAGPVDAGDSTTSTPALPACVTCEAREGEGLGGRTVIGDDGRHRPCPDCRPAAA